MRWSIDDEMARRMDDERAEAAAAQAEYEYRDRLEHDLDMAARLLYDELGIYGAMARLIDTFEASIRKRATPSPLTDVDSEPF